MSDAVNKFMYGIGEVTIGEVVVGFIEKDSFQFNGKEAEIVEVFASQNKGAPVAVLTQKAATIAPSFNLIQLDFANLELVMGGKKTETSWEAPAEVVTIEKKVVIKTDSGHTITIPKAKIVANFEGGLLLTDVAKVKVTLTPLAESAEAAPYKIEKTVG